MRKIHFSEELPEDGNGVLLHYQNLSISAKGWRYIDVRDEVEKYEDAWLQKISKWHSQQITKLKGISDWWSLTLASRLILWKTTSEFDLKPLLFFLVLEKLIEKEDKDIWVVYPSKELVDLVCEWASRSTTVQAINHIAVDDNASAILLSVVQIINVLKTLTKIICLLGFRKRKKISLSDIIVNSALLDSNVVEKVGDHFFGFMIDELNRNDIGQVAWVYNDLRLKKRSSVERVLNKYGRKYYFLSDLFQWKDLVVACVQAYSLNRKTRKSLNSIVEPLKTGMGVSLLFPTNYIDKLVLREPPILEIVVFQIFSRLFNQSFARYIIYPYEEKAIEHAMLMAATRTSTPIRTIGFAHAGYSKGHLYIRRNDMCAIPRPDHIAVTGSSYKSRFMAAGVPENQITVIGSPRFQNLIGGMHFTNNKKLRLLFICGLGFELYQFAQILIKYPVLSTQYDVFIRRSFHSWKHEQDKAESVLVEEGISYTLAGSSLIDEIDYSDIILYESTSAAFQASLRGKLVLKIDLSSVVRTSHFVPDDHSSMFDKCLSGKELVGRLDEIKLMTRVEYESLIKHQRKSFERLFSALSKKRFSELFNI